MLFAAWNMYQRNVTQSIFVENLQRGKGVLCKVNQRVTISLDGNRIENWCVSVGVWISPVGGAVVWFFWVTQRFMC